MKKRAQTRRPERDRHNKDTDCLGSLNTISSSGIARRAEKPLPAYGGLAQLGERLPCKQEVSGSIPLISTTYGLIAQLVRAHA